MRRFEIGVVRMNQGFSLIELLAVLLIFAIVFGIALPKIYESIENSKSLAFYNDVNTFERMITLYQISRTDIPKSSVTEIGEILGKDIPNTSTSNVSDKDWNVYAKYHLNEYIQGGWPEDTPFGGYYTYRYYDKSWEYLHNWEKVISVNNTNNSSNLGEFLDKYDVEVIMIRFIDGGNFEGAVESLLNSPFKNKIYRYKNQRVIGILVSP